MRKFVVLIRFQAIAVTGILSVSAILGLPVLAQEAEEEEQPAPIEVVTPVVEEPSEPLDAITADNPEIPTNQLEILLKPLTQEQLQAEADAWYELLQGKAQEISDLEYDINLRENEKIGGDVDSQKEQDVIESTQLQTEQTTLVSRLSTVLDSLEAKGGDPTLYRQYSDTVSGLEFNITDTEGLGLRFTTWLQSEEGGIKWGLNLLKFGGILIATSVIAPRAGKVADKALVRLDNVSTLFRGFIVMMVKRSVLLVGGLLALASIGVNLGPILAVVGGASFVLAFALQSNLGNFASGLMLLISKPFDVGDEVKVSGYWAYVDSISLANTKLKDFGGNIITLPNNTVWGGDIINYTHTDIRKLSLGINIKFRQDVDQIQKIWFDIASSHPNVLKDPGPGIFPWNATYDYHIWVGLTAWAKTDDYWGVYVDALKSLQQQLTAHNIELAAPVQEIKLDESTTHTLDAQNTTVKESNSSDAVPA